MTRKQKIEIIRTAGLCGIASGFISASLGIAIAGQLAIAILVAAMSFCWDYATLTVGKRQ